MKNIVIFDLDDTLSNTSHRQHHLTGKPDWDAFFAASKDDSPREDAIELFNFYLNKNDIVLIFTGRDESTKEYTMQWLFKHTDLKPDTENFTIMMRPKGSFVKDTDMKLNWLNALGDARHNIKVIYEDRTSVVNMWREQGLTCYQVAQNDF